MPPAQPQVELYDSGGALRAVLYANGSDQAVVHHVGSTDELIVGDGTLTYQGNEVLTTADEGSGNGLNADQVDGIEGANILTTSDEGPGNGLDADTVDGVEESALAALADNETVTGDWTYSPSNQLRLSSGVLDLLTGVDIDWATDSASGTFDDYNAQFQFADADTAATVLWQRQASAGKALQIKNDTTGSPLLTVYDDGDIEVPNGVLSEQGNDVLTTADEGSGNGLNADQVDGIEGADILTTSDEGSGNGLDADTVDGEDASAFADASHASQHVDGGGDEIDAGDLDGSSGVSGEVLSTNGSTASWTDPDTLNIDADTLDGSQGSAYAKRADNETISGTYTFNGGFILETSAGTPAGTSTGQMWYDTTED